MPDTLLAAVQALPPGSTVLCAVSGGADSVYLLYRLSRLRADCPFQVVAAHYNHRLRGEESDRDEAFVRQFVASWCGELRVTGEDGERILPPVQLITGSGDVAEAARQRKTGLEETAREMRYAFLQQAAEEAGAGFIATAHNADDNAETLLLNLLRGTGLRGLGGIPPVRGCLIRPMLGITRREIEDYLNLHGIPHVEDSSNQSDGMLRNRIRHRVLPLLEELSPGITGRTRDLIASLRADEALLSSQAEALVSGASSLPGTIRVPASAVGTAPDPLAVRAVRVLIGRLRGGDQDCSSAHLESVVHICRGDSPSARASLPGGITARREYGDLVLTFGEAPPPCPETVLTLPGETSLGCWLVSVHKGIYSGEPQTPWSFWLRGSVTSLTARTRQAGDTLRRPGRSSRSLKKLLIDEKIPRHLRDSLPVLCADGRLAAAAGLGPDSAFCPKPGETAWHVTASAAGPGGGAESN